MPFNKNWGPMLEVNQMTQSIVSGIIPNSEYAELCAKPTALAYQAINGPKSTDLKINVQCGNGCGPASFCKLKVHHNAKGDQPTSFACKDKPWTPGL
eukprot:NODE_2725_length_650_cov_80.965058_g2252_i0.p2 GENE.NODE_2725_length_650_cov_80.965058_g2252_i0~~NODE_2725_length_650_cov_80.965058_g2252_i0.p2  ORF type:complete len:97 (+),score=24.13 NODE_2725_length_650_cov_80.965058_g2252_i0:54-344(+)